MARRESRIAKRIRTQMIRTGETLLVGQSGGCTQVMNASLLGVVEEARRCPAIGMVWGMRGGIEGLLRGDLVDLSSVGIEELLSIARVPAAALGSCRRKIADAEADEIVRSLVARRVRYLAYIGGNDSADTAHRLARAARRLSLDLRAVAVPKTIDNDLPCTDHSPGYGSAARFIASVTADAGMETEAMGAVEPVKVIEVMGRNAGWLACASALGKRSDRDAPQIVWPPEVPFERRRFLRLVKESLDRLGYCLVVVAQTVRDTRGRLVGGRMASERDAFGHPRAEGAAETLCRLVREGLGVRARFDKPGTIQRLSSAHVSPVDFDEARSCGNWAVRFAVEGRSGCMVIMRRRRGSSYGVEYDTVPISRVANRERLLPDAYFDRAVMLPTEAFRRYALPLVGPGLPAHARLRGEPVVDWPSCSAPPGT